MNTQLTQPQTSLSHPPDTLAQLAPLAPVANRIARTSLLDRAAMRVGLWLLLWGSRPASDADALERHRRRTFHAEQRERHEADAAYATRLWMHGA